MSKLVFLDLCAWQLSTEETETSDLAFNGGEGDAVHLKQRPLQCHSFVNMSCINNVAAILKAPLFRLDRVVWDGVVGWSGGGGVNCLCFHLSTHNSYMRKRAQHVQVSAAVFAE